MSHNDHIVFVKAMRHLVIYLSISLSIGSLFRPEYGFITLGVLMITTK